MKTIKYKIIVFVLIISNCSLYAQYDGGDADGSSSETLSINSCSIPPSFYTYFGGDADAATVDNLLNTTCPFSNNFYAYFGGDGDSSSVETLESQICGFPPQFFTYFGGNTDGAVVDITAPLCPTAVPVASFTASATEICVGQSVTFTDTSTNIPSSWIWTFTGGTANSSTVQNPVITYNTPGNYTVTLVTANYNGNDTETRIGYINVLAYPTVTTTTPANRCGTGTVTLSATASAGTLSWYANSIGGVALGTGASFTTPSISINTPYYVEAKNGSCSSARTSVLATVIVTSPPTATANQTFCDAEKVGSIAVIPSGPSIIWYDSSTGGNVIPNNTVLVSGSIYYASQTISGCESTSRAAVTMTGGACLGTEKFETNVVKLYPNPAVDLVTISSSVIISKIQVVNVSGQIIFEGKINQIETKVDLSTYPSGAYLIKVLSEENKMKTFKVIKK